MLGGICFFSFAFLRLGALTLAAALGVFLTNGFINGASVHFIHSFVPQTAVMLVYSLWCLVGDLGSVAGGMLVDLFVHLICQGEHPVMICQPTNKDFWI